jgi:hypothetical protein
MGDGEDLEARVKRRSQLHLTCRLELAVYFEHVVWGEREGAHGMLDLHHARKEPVLDGVLVDNYTGHLVAGGEHAVARNQGCHGDPFRHAVITVAEAIRECDTG